MTSVRQLFSLQELDLALDSVKSQIAKAQQELNSRLSLEQVEQTLQTNRDNLEEVQANHRMQQPEAETLRERSSLLEAHLYGGDVTNARDLPGMQLESSNVKAQLDQKELALLELSVRAEDLRSKIAQLEQELADRQQAWDTRHAQLTEQVATLNAESEDLIAQRDKMAADIDQSEVGKYENLRKNKGGTAVAKVERGLCQACRMSLPSQHLQRVKSGRQLVLCSSCGRMLFLG